MCHGELWCERGLLWPMVATTAGRHPPLLKYIYLYKHICTCICKYVIGFCASSVLQCAWHIYLSHLLSSLYISICMYVCMYKNVCCIYIILKREQRERKRDMIYCQLLLCSAPPRNAGVCARFLATEKEEKKKK